MTKKTYSIVDNLISNIIDTTYNAYKVNAGLILNDEKKIMSDIKKIHKLAPNLDDDDLDDMKCSLPHDKEYAGGSLGDLVMDARILSYQLFFKYYDSNIQ